MEKIGFKPTYIKNEEIKEQEKEEEKGLEEKELEEKQSTEEEKNQKAMEAMAKILDTDDKKASPNQILVSQKIMAYIELIKSPEYSMKSDQEKEAIINDLLLFQSISTELSTLRSI